MIIGMCCVPASHPIVEPRWTTVRRIYLPIQVLSEARYLTGCERLDKIWSKLDMGSCLL